MLQIGDYIVFESTNDYNNNNIGGYSVGRYTPVNTPFATTTGAIGGYEYLFDDSNEYAAFLGTTGTNIYTAITANVNTGNNVLSIFRHNGVASPATLPGAGSAIADTAIINGNTPIVVVSDIKPNGGTASTTERYAKLISRDVLIALFKEKINLQLGFVAKKPSVGGAAVVYLTVTDIALDDITGLPVQPDRYGYVLDNNGSGNLGGMYNNATNSLIISNTSNLNVNNLYLNQAVVYDSNRNRTVVNVCAYEPQVLFAGNFVKLTSTYVELRIPGREGAYYFVETVDNFLSMTGYKGDWVVNDDKYTGKFYAGTNTNNVAKILASVKGNGFGGTNANSNFIVGNTDGIQRLVGTATFAYLGGDEMRITIGGTTVLAKKGDFRILINYGSADTFASMAPPSGTKGELALDSDTTKNIEGSIWAVAYTDSTGFLLGITFFVDNGKTKIEWSKTDTASVWQGWAARP